MARRRPYDVVFYVPWIGPLLSQGREALPAGGAETQIHLLARALARRGIRPCLIAFETPGGLPASLDGVDIVVRRRYRPHQRIIGKVSETLLIWHSLARVRGDVIVTRASGSHPAFVGLFAKATRRRFVHSSANIVDFDFHRIEPKRRNRFLFHLGMRFADELVVQTDEQVRLCEQRLSRRPALIRSIAEPAACRTEYPEAFLWIGRLVSYKQPLAYIQLARAVPEARFWMVGVPVPHGAPAEELVARVTEEAEGVPNLELLEPRPRSQLMELIDRSVAIVNTADFEGMPNIFLEGWCRGVPALALSHDPDGVIERYGLGGFAHESPGRLAKLAQELWQGRDDQSALAEPCLSYIRDHHSADVVAERWIDALGLEDRGRSRMHAT